MADIPVCRQSILKSETDCSVVSFIFVNYNCYSHNSFDLLIFACVCITFTLPVNTLVYNYFPLTNSAILLKVHNL